ncbi:MAG: RNA polymerase sigma factor [Planctomycetota bacterium]
MPAAIAGDRDATARLLVAHGDRLANRLARRLELNPFADFSVEDALQEAYVDAFVGISSFDLSKGSSFSAWLDKVVDNRLVTMLRERQRQKRTPQGIRIGDNAWRSSAAELGEVLSDYRGCAPCEEFAQGEVVDAIRNHAAELPRDQRDAIELHCLDGRSIDSTAQILGKTEGAVRGLVRRAKQSLRVALGNSSRWFRRK